MLLRRIKWFQRWQACCVWILRDVWSCKIPPLPDLQSQESLGCSYIESMSLFFLYSPTHSMVAQTCFTDLIIYDHQDVADPTQKLLALFQLLKKDCWSFFGVLQGIANHLFPKNLPKLWCSSDSRFAAMLCSMTSGSCGIPNRAFFSSPMEARTSANLRSPPRRDHFGSSFSCKA